MENVKTKSLSLLTKRQTLALLLAISFLIPFLIPGPQIVLGSIVNASIIASSLSLPLSFSLPIILAPSLATLSRGLIFGSLTKFLLFFLPGLWLGNFLYWSIFKTLFKEKKFPYFFSLIVASLAKALFLYSLALILVNLNLVPKIFLLTMGSVQFFTAFTGGAIIFFIRKLKFFNV